jgi:hypothetical protein
MKNGIPTGKAAVSRGESGPKNRPEKAGFYLKNDLDCELGNGVTLSYSTYAMT